MKMGESPTTTTTLSTTTSTSTSTTATTEVLKSSTAPPFISKTYAMVDDPWTDSIVCWTDDNNSFVVSDVSLFSEQLLPNYFKHNNFASFVRQLNTYGFRKVDPDRWEFANESFLRGQKHLLKSITRRKPFHALPQVQHHQPSIQTTSVNSCVEVGKFALEDQVQVLKRDKDDIMQELSRLRQQQQSTDNQLQNVGHRVQGMEKRQQQMMSFLATAMQTPGFLAQIVQKKSDSSNRLVTAGSSKKRRLPNHDDENANIQSIRSTLSDGHVVKYQPLINEAAKSMLRQILKLNGPLPDHLLRDPNAFLIDHVPSTSALAANGSCLTRTSGVTLSEVPQDSNRLPFPALTGVSNHSEPAMRSKVHSSSNIGIGLVEEARVPEIGVQQSQGDVMPSLYGQMEGVLSESPLGIPTNTEEHNSDLAFIDSMPTIQNGSSPMDVGPSPTAELDMLLPGSNDKFWEQFFPVSPLRELTEEVDSGTQEGEEDEMGQGEGLEELYHLNHLTKQMGLLTAEAELV